MSALHSQGIQLKHGDGTTPTEAFTLVGNITKFQGPGGKATIIDATTLDSVAKEKIPGLRDEGTVTFDINYDPANVVHKALIADRASQRLVNWKMTLSDPAASVIAFSAYIIGFSIDGAVDAKLTASVELEVTGAVTWPS